MGRDAPWKPAALVTEDKFAALVRAFLTSPKFRGYKAGTQDTWGRALQFAARPDTLGNVSLMEIRPALVQAYLDGLEGRPGKQATALAVLKVLDRWASVRELLPRPITFGVETESPQGGHKPWTDEEVAYGEAHARADLARVITLAANTGQRGSDLVRMCPTDIETYKGIDGIHLIQQKTGREVWVPITSELAAAMATWERRPGPFLIQQNGKPWDRKQISAIWRYHMTRDPVLAQLKERWLVIHGLRGTACVRLRRAGATTAQIADMVGMSEPMVARYCRLSLQRENAVAAVHYLERTISERNAGRATCKT